MWRSESSYQNERARCLTNMPLAFALVQVIRKFQLLEVQVTLAVNAVSERSKAVAQLSWKLMHRWACFGVCCGSRMIVLESSEGTLHVRTNRPDRHCLSWITIFDQLLLPFRLSHPLLGYAASSHGLVQSAAVRTVGDVQEIIVWIL